MIPYFLLLLYIIIVCNNVKDNNKCLIFCLIPFFIFIASQDGWTPDYESYLEDFEIAHRDWMASRYFYNFEFLYSLINYVLPSYRIILIIQYLLFSTSLYIVFYNYIPRKYWILAFIIFWIDFNMMLMAVSAIRSCITASLFIIAFHLRNKSKILIPYTLLISSFFIHKGSILVLLLMILCEFRNKIMQTILFVTVLLVLVIILINPGIFNTYLILFLESNDDFESYSDYAEISSFTIGAVANRFLRILCVVYLSILFFKYNHFDNYILYSSMLCTIVMITLLAMPNVGAVTRYCVYFGPLMLICYSNLYSIENGKLRYMLYSYTILYSLYYLFFQVPQMPSWEKYSHYKSVLF